MNKLNEKVWNSENKLHEDIKEKLLQISKIFLKDIETPIKIENILLTGSLASFQWRPTSDFDLHIIVEITDKNCIETALDYFDSKSKIFNKEHDIFLKGYKVEVNLKTEEVLLPDKGVYDILKDEWIVFPKTPRREMDDIVVLKLSEKIKLKINNAITNNADLNVLKDIRNKLKELRTTGLKKEGEYSIGNLVFKKLRHDGYIKKLYDYKAKIKNEKLSLEHFIM
jgi:predicted nucleotidyltransferase